MASSLALRLTKGEALIRSRLVNGRTLGLAYLRSAPHLSSVAHRAWPMPDLFERLKAALADRYRVERELGAGGMATVYLAEDLKHKRRVAVKVLRPELAAVLGAERFVQEITTTASLQHPHILPLFDSGEADGFLYYVMPYVEGETLREKLNRETQLPIDEAVRITGDVADALDYAHRNGVIHRDIKPENILLHDGRPTVADFGIALAVSAAAGGRMTETGLSLGTPHYMSPEQATAEKDITNRSDIYSLGSVLYEMLTGSPPHVGSSAQQIIMKIVTEEAQPLTQLRKSVPPHVAVSAAKALEKLPADRFASARDFAEALQGRGDVSVLGARLSEVAATDATPTAVGWRSKLRDPFVVIPSLVAVVLAVVVGLGRQPSTPDLRLLRSELEPPAGTEYAEFLFAALSPDGRRMAFVGLGATGGRQLWIRDLETGRVDSLASTRGAEGPFWSPTGRSVGYFADGALWRIEFDGNAPRQLCEETDGVGGSWSGENLILFTRAGHPMTVHADGGRCAAVPGAWSDSGLSVSQPTWFPDGRHFAAVELVNPPKLIRSSIDGDPPRLFLDQAQHVIFVKPDLVVFTRAGGAAGADIIAQRFDPKSLDLVGEPTTLAEGVRAASAYPSYAVTAAALAYLPVAQADEGPLLVDANGVVRDSVAVQGSWTLRHAWNRSAVALAGFGLWVYDLERHTSVSVKRTGDYAFPVWNPGDSILAVSELTGGGTDTACPVLLVWPGRGIDSSLTGPSASGACAQPSDWTSDGQFLVLTVFSVGDESRGAIWTYALETGAFERQVTVDGTASAGVVSPDLRWLAYVSDETGELQVYVRPFRGNGPAVPVSNTGGGLPRWRGDGRALFYQVPDGSIRRVAVAAGSRLVLGEPEVLFRAPRWSARLFADQWRGAQATTPYDVRPDGQRFLVRQRVERTSAAVLLLNWQSLLERE